jgi:pimeloyl-ACP methyl ester carboxylesterase
MQQRLSDEAESYYGHRLRLDRERARRLRGAVGRVFGSPLLDPLASLALRRLFFPLSRLWAAADEARGSAEAFAEAAGMPLRANSRDRLMLALERFEQSRAESEAIDAAWERMYFPGQGRSGETPSAGERVGMEQARLNLAHKHNLARRNFRFLLGSGVPRVRLEIASTEEVEASYGAALSDAAPFFAPPGNWPDVEISRPVPTAEGRDYWVRFASPSPRLGDTVYARVYEPSGIASPPTVIFGHGLCVEYDQWSGLVDEAVELCRLGLRVIRPEAPWHGRRRPRGYYGAERMIGSFPAGSLDLFTGAVREWAVLADWARRSFPGPLGFGGASLGALTAQLAACRSKDWPAALRPDALLLITHCEQLSRASMEGELSQMWGNRSLWESRGWSPDLVDRFMSIVDPGASLCIPPENIVTVLGKHDTITPFAGGMRLIDAWRVPEDNRFIWNRGHFSIPVTLLHDHAPLERFAAILRRAPSA